MNNAFGIACFLIGIFFGSFAGAQILYPIFITLPLFSKLKRSGQARAIPWNMVIFPPVLGLSIILALSKFLPNGGNKTSFFWGAAVSSFFIITKAGSPENKQETLEVNKTYLIENEYDEIMGYDNSDHVVFTCPQCKKKFNPRASSIFCSDKCDKEFQIELNNDIAAQR